MKIGIMQTGRAPEMLAPDHGDYPDMFERLLAGHGLTFQTWAVLDNDIPAWDPADGWLITGSKFGAYEDHAWIPPLEGLIRDIYAHDIPMVGVCFGHQIIAQALGGKVEKFDGGWSIGRVTYDLDGEDDGQNILAFHQDQVVELPEDATVVGRTDFCKYAMLAYGDKALTLQPHPEFDDGFMNGLLTERGPGLVDPGILAEASDGLGVPLQTQRIANRFAEFFKNKKLAA